MSIETYIPAYAEPVHLTEMKVHLNADADITTWDTLISSLTTSARDVVEVMTGANVPRNRVMLATTFDLTLHYFPGCDYIRIPRVPIVAITSIAYVDTNGNSQTFDANSYVISEIEGIGPIVHLAYGESWPDTRDQVGAVTVRFVAGQAATFTAATTDICTVYGRTFSNGDRVQVKNSGGALPTGLSAGVTYFVVEVSGSTFKLSLTSGGAAIDITVAGTGTQYIALDMMGFETLRSAMKLAVAKLYMHRGDGAGDARAIAVADMAINALVASQHA